MEQVIYGKGEGMGYISNDYYEIDDLINDFPITINNVEILPGELTDLCGYFCRKIEYLGLFKRDDHSKEMIFFLGSDDNSLFPKYYYSAIMKIDENRIFEMFSHKGGRDHILVNNKWK